MSIQIQQLPGLPAGVLPSYFTEPTLEGNEEGWYPWAVVPGPSSGQAANTIGVAVGNLALTQVGFVVQGDSELVVEWVGLHSTISSWPTSMGVALNFNLGGNYSIFNRPVRAELICAGATATVRQFISKFPWRLVNRGGSTTITADITDVSNSTNTVQLVLGGRRREYRGG